MRELLSLALVLPALAQENQANVKAAIEDRYKEWMAAANKKDATALSNLYDDNAVLMSPREEAVLGKAAIIEWYKKLSADPHYVPFTETVDLKSFHVMGDIAIETSNFEGDATRGGKQTHFRGKHLIVWKKQEDDSWKLFRYMFDEIPQKK